MSKTKNISEFGYSFQVKFIVCLITDKLFLEQIVDILDEKYITNDGFKWIVKEIREYYNEYKTTITMEVFKIKIKEIESDLLQVNVKDSLKEKYKLLLGMVLQFCLFHPQLLLFYPETNEYYDNKDLIPE